MDVHHANIQRILVVSFGLTYALVGLHRYKKQQRSKPIGLEKGRVYYMEAFLKEGGGGDHLTVRVKLPSGSTRTPLMKNLYTRPPVGKLTLQLIPNFYT